MVEIDYGALLRESNAAYIEGDAAKRAGDAKRTAAVKAAHERGGWSLRRIAAEIGVNHQMVAKLLRRR